MGSFKRTVGINGKFKICVTDGHFVDSETGEEIPVAEILEKIYGIIYSLSPLLISRMKILSKG